MWDRIDIFGFWMGCGQLCQLLHLGTKAVHISHITYWWSSCPQKLQHFEVFPSFPNNNSDQCSSQLYNWRTNKPGNFYRHAEGIFKHWQLLKIGITTCRSGLVTELCAALCVLMMTTFWKTVNLFQIYFL